MSNFEITRADFLRQGSKAFLALALGQSFTRLARAAAPGPKDCLVVIFLRGGYDALSLVPPIAGPDRELYEAARPNLKIAATGDHAALRLDDRFGLHPSAKSLHELYQSGQLAFVHAAGMPSDNRSHFDAQTFVELGTPGSKRSTTGWISRMLLAHGPNGPANASALAALSIGNLVPTSLSGYSRVTVLDSVRGFDLGGDRTVQNYQRDALRKMYGGTAWIDQYGRDTLMALDAIEAAHPGDYKPSGGVKANILRVKSAASCVRWRRS